MMRIRVNPIMCEAHGLCAELFPEWIRLDEWGYPIINPDSLPRGLEAHARRARGSGARRLSQSVSVSRSGLMVLDCQGS
jgi:ferredoxin